MFVFVSSHNKGEYPFAKIFVLLKGMKECNMIMFKNSPPPIYDIFGNLTYVEINFDQNLQLASLVFRGKAKKNWCPFGCSKTSYLRF